jgi:hypothetical protein
MSFDHGIGIEEECWSASINLKTKHTSENRHTRPLPLPMTLRDFVSILNLYTITDSQHPEFRLY